MILIEAKRREVKAAAYKLRSAQEGDYGRLLTEPSVIAVAGRLAVVYLPLPPQEDMEPLRGACARISYSTHFRTGGLKTTSKIFGYSPRVTIRRDYCSATAFAREQPDEHATVARAALLVERYYRQFNAELYGAHRALAEEKIPHEYRLHGTAFTSGIVNENNPLKYHYDAGNFRGVWSGMIVFKSGIEGGHLALPEFGLGVELCDRSLFLFDGQGILHGVTPIVRTRPDAKRYSIVYYSLQNMWSCRPLGEELDRIRQKRTEREAKRAAKQVRSDTPG